MSTYWYEQNSKLWPGMIFLTEQDEVVRLERRVPGDATKWYVANIGVKGWEYWDDTVEASDLKQHLP